MLVELAVKLRAPPPSLHRTNDNALVETKNGAVIRKWLGYQFLPSQAAELIENFYRDWLNRYLNFHRSCAFATLEPDRRGKLRKVYRQWQTPLEKLLSLPDEQRRLRDGVSVDRLEQQAKAESDTAFAELLQAQRDELQRSCKDLAIRWGPQ